jgi:hypothetical protein
MLAYNTKHLRKCEINIFVSMTFQRNEPWRRTRDSTDSTPPNVHQHYQPRTNLPARIRERHKERHQLEN